MHRKLHRLHVGIRATKSSLPFHLPETYMYYLEKLVIDNANAMPNVSRRPSTPDILVTSNSRALHYQSDGEYGFGATCIVLQSSHAKRADQAAARETTTASLNKG